MVQSPANGNVSEISPCTGGIVVRVLTLGSGAIVVAVDCIR